MDESLESLAEQVLDAHRPGNSPTRYLAIADTFRDGGQRRLEAAAVDRAWSFSEADARAPDTVLSKRRDRLLDELAIEEHGLRFRFVPAGSFLMGSENGQDDEKPVHPVRLQHFWIADTPITWHRYCKLLGWQQPPAGFPPEDELERHDRTVGFRLSQANKIRLQYCESDTIGARDWHAHQPETEWSDGRTSEQIFGRVPRASDSAYRYDDKPMVASAWQDGEQLGKELSTGEIRYRLPTEAEWEKAARGGLIGKPYSWGDDRPDGELCDYGQFGEFRIRNPRDFPPNGYGLFGMCGGVWEWTRTRYDALAYAEADAVTGPAEPDLKSEAQHVLRGGSWADSAKAITVSFRMGRQSSSWLQEGYGLGSANPNVGFRLCRVEKISVPLLGK